MYEVDKSSLYAVWKDLNKAKLAISMLLTPMVNPLVMFLETWSEDESGNFEQSNIFSDDEEISELRAQRALQTKNQI